LTTNVENFDEQRLSENLEALFNYVQRVRTEIASLNQSGDGEDKFVTMGEQLDGVIEATKDASDDIMAAIEKNNEAVAKLKESLNDPNLIGLVDVIKNGNNEVFEACAFQYIIGQRVTKIIKSVSYVEGRVIALREIWGNDAPDNVERVVEDMTEDEKLLNGPQSKAEAISQEEIDKLFS